MTLEKGKGWKGWEVKGVEGTYKTGPRTLKRGRVDGRQWFTFHESVTLKIHRCPF